MSDQDLHNKSADEKAQMEETTEGTIDLRRAKPSS